MWLIVGLGNPGPSFAGHRHNIGFMAADSFVRRQIPLDNWRQKFHGDIAEFAFNGEKIVILKPMSFMNLSGGAVQAAAQFYKIPTSQILVIHDELDLPFGRLKLKRGGGAGGHNGLRSIDSHLGQDYHRLRLGIGHPGNKDRVSPYVLGDFSAVERPLVTDWLAKIADHLPLILDGKAGLFQTRLAPPPEKKSNVPPKPDPDQPALS